MTDYSYEVKEATRSAVLSALNNGMPIYNATHSAVDNVVRQMDFSEAIQAGVVQAAQMGLLTPEYEPTAEVEKLRAALLLATKRGHYWACPGAREPGTIYHGPCSARCLTIRKELGELADTESKTHPTQTGVPEKETPENKE